MGTGRVGCVWSVRCERAWRGDAESAARSAAIAAGSAPLKVFFSAGDRVGARARTVALYRPPYKGPCAYRSVMCLSCRPSSCVVSAV